jgi:hypothetical protein
MYMKKDAMDWAWPPESQELKTGPWNFSLG